MALTKILTTLKLLRTTITVSRLTRYPGNNKQREAESKTLHSFLNVETLLLYLILHIQHSSQSFSGKSSPSHRHKHIQWRNHHVAT